MIGDLIGKVITKYSANVEEHVEKLKELQAEEKALAATQTAAAAEHNAGLSSTLVALGAVGLALEATKEIWEGYKLSVQEAKLEHAAAGVEIEGLSRAAGGLKTELELLTFAAKAHKSAWHNTQEDLETAERAMRALEARGLDTETATNAVTNAVVGLKTKGLKALGIELDDSKVKIDEFGNVLGTAGQKAELHQKILEALGKVAGEVADDQDNIGDSMKRTEVKLDESWEGLKKGLGKLVVAMQPLLEALAEAVDLTAQIAGAVIGGFGDQGFMGNAVGKFKQRQQLHTGEGTFGSYSGAVMRDGIFQGNEDAQALAEVADRQRALAMFLTNKYLTGPEIETMEFHGATKAKATPEETAAAAAAIGREMLKQLGANVTGEYGANVSHQFLRDEWVRTGHKTGLNEPTGTSDSLGMAAGNAGEQDAITKALGEHYNDEKAKRDKSNLSFMQKSFGKIDEIHLYKEAFGALSSAVSAGYKAMVEGSMSFGAAFKLTIANALEAEGEKMQILALENTAYGIAALALGPIGGTSAAGYFTAAAMFEAGAIAAGVGAHYLGAGGGGGGGAARGSSSRGATPSSVPAGAGGHGNVTNTTIIYGGEFTDQSTRQRAIGARKMLSLAQGPGTGKDQVVYA